MIETYRGAVTPSELDHMGHMNVQYYVAKFGDATWHAFAALGMTTAYFKDENRGMAAVEQKLVYLAEALAGDLLACRSEILDVGAKTVRFRHHMYDTNTDAPVATCEIVAVHIDRGLRKSCPLPEFVAEKGRALMSAAEG